MKNSSQKEKALIFLAFLHFHTLRVLYSCVDSYKQDKLPNFQLQLHDFSCLSPCFCPSKNKQKARFQDKKKLTTTSKQSKLRCFSALSVMFLHLGQMTKGWKQRVHRVHCISSHICSLNNEWSFDQKKYWQKGDGEQIVQHAVY